MNSYNFNFFFFSTAARHNAGICMSFPSYFLAKICGKATGSNSKHYKYFFGSVHMRENGGELDSAINIFAMLLSLEPVCDDYSSPSFQPHRNSDISLIQEQFLFIFRTQNPAKFNQYHK